MSKLWEWLFGRGPIVVMSARELDQLRRYVERNGITTAEQFKACVDRDLKSKRET